MQIILAFALSKALETPLKAARQMAAMPGETAAQMRAKDRSR